MSEKCSDYNEPWHVATNPGGPQDQPAFPSIRDSSELNHGQDIVAMPLGNSETVKRLAARIVAAVNFCEGQSLEELLPLTEILKNGRNRCNENVSLENEIRNLRAELEAANGKAAWVDKWGKPFVECPRVGGAFSEAYAELRTLIEKGKS